MQYRRGSVRAGPSALGFSMRRALFSSLSAQEDGFILSILLRDGQRLSLKRGKAEPHLDMVGPLQQPLVQLPGIVPTPLVDFKVDIGLHKRQRMRERLSIELPLHHHGEDALCSAMCGGEVQGGGNGLQPVLIRE